MSIQDPMNSLVNKSFIAVLDNDGNLLKSTSDVALLSDEDRFNSIALSVPPFSPFSDSPINVMTEINNSNPLVSISQPNIEQMDCFVPVIEPTVGVDMRDYSLDRNSSNKCKNKRKKERDFNSGSSVSKRQILGERGRLTKVSLIVPLILWMTWCL